MTYTNWCAMGLFSKFFEIAHLHEGDITGMGDGGDIEILLVERMHDDSECRDTCNVDDRDHLLLYSSNHLYNR